MANAYDAILNQYKKDTTPAKRKKSGQVDLNRYFTTYLDEGVDSATKTIRILPHSVEGESPFIKMHVHSMNVGGKWEKIICPEKEDIRESGLKVGKEGECPICEAKRLLYNEGTEEAAEQAKKYNTRQMYVIRVIDRDDEDFGPKWFRFWYNGKNEGVMDQILSLMQTYKTDVTDENNGMDLILNIKRDSRNPRVCKVVSILPGDRGSLYSDETVAKEWINNGETWRDAYSVKPYEYLKIVAINKTPVWSSDAKGYVAKEDEGTNNNETESISNSEIIMGGSNQAENEQPITKEPINNTKNTSEEEDDLPF